MSDITITITYTLPSADAQSILAAWKELRPMNAGETTAQYARRVLKELGQEEARKGNAQITSRLNSSFSPSIIAT